MDAATLYHDDIVAWAEQQAAALRELAGRPELSNAVDGKISLKRWSAWDAANGRASRASFEMFLPTS
jgi:hypothetical protein